MSSKILEDTMVEFHKFGDSQILITNGTHKGYIVDVDTLEEVVEKADEVDGGKELHKENELVELPFDSDEVSDEMEERMNILYQNVDDEEKENVKSLMKDIKRAVE